MTDWDPAAFENDMIADMRAHGGAVTTGPLAGATLLVMTVKGAKSGKPRRAILTFTRDADDYIVSGSAGGSPIDPSWVHNVAVNPNVSVEAEGRTFEATAAVANSADRDRLWERHVAAHPNFGAYPEQSGRAIPMVRLKPVKDRP
jgi:deazaflavin-dependent oxidoreductase (nitroreductase family)